MYEVFVEVQTVRCGGVSATRASNRNAGHLRGAGGRKFHRVVEAVVLGCVVTSSKKSEPCLNNCSRVTDAEPN